MNWRSPIFIGILIIAILITVGWSYFSKKKAAAPTTQTQTTETKVSNLTNMDPTDFDETVKKEYALANSKAIEANTGAKIAAIEVEIGKDLLPASINVRYIFTSASDANNNWMITFSEVSGNYIRALVPKADYLGVVSEMNTKLWKYNYVTALQLAEKNGGLTWRESNELTDLKLTLRHAGANNWLEWIVEYHGASGNLTVKLDANSGKVVTE